MPERILVVRLGSMGDVLHSLPVAHALRRALPDAFIGWAVEERWTPLLVANGSPRTGPRGPMRPLVDAVHVLNTKAWRGTLLSDETWAEMRNALHGIRSTGYDTALDVQGAFKSALIAQLSGAPSRVGFQNPREKPASLFYTTLVQPTGKHIIEQNLSLVREITRDNRDPDISFPLPVDAAAESFIESALKEYGLKSFALLNPGAGWAAKRWPAERYGEVARALGAAGLPAIVNYAPGEERLASEVERTSGGAARAMSCSIGELIALARHASLFIGGDTGPMHLAAAVGVPVVTLFGPTDPARNGPYSTKAVVLRNAASVTTLSHSAAADPGMMAIAPAEVIAAAERLLTRTGAA